MYRYCVDIESMAMVYIDMISMQYRNHVDIISILNRYSIDLRVWVSIRACYANTQEMLKCIVLRLFLRLGSIWARVEQPLCGLKRTAGIADGFYFRVDSFLRLSGRMSQSKLSAEAPPGVRIEHHNALVIICRTWRSGEQTDAKLVSMGEESLRILILMTWAQQRQLPNETVESLA